MHSVTKRIPGGTYTADATIAEFDCGRDLGGVVIAAHAFLPSATVTVATDVDVTFRGVYDTTADGALVDWDIATGTLLKYIATFDNAEIDDPATEANGAKESAPLFCDKVRIAIDATWGGGNVVLSDMWVTFIIIPHRK